MLKNQGKKKNAYVICEKCKQKLYLQDLEENGDIEKIGKITLATCNYCGEDFEI